jgi:hypothetical protein
MGNTKFKFVEANGKLTIQFDLDATQDEYAKKAYGWTAQIPDPENEGQMIDNVPFPVFWAKYHLEELNNRAKQQYISENSATVVSDATIAINISPVEDENL